MASVGMTSDVRSGSALPPHSTLSGPCAALAAPPALHRRISHKAAHSCVCDHNNPLADSLACRLTDIELGRCRPHRRGLNSEARSQRKWSGDKAEGGIEMI